MIVKHPPDVTDRFTTDFIRGTAKKLIAEGTFPTGELEDLIQDLTLNLLERWHHFVCERARWSTFVRTVVTRRAISLRRRQLAEMRQEEQATTSLTRMLPDDDGRLTEQTLDVREEDVHRNKGEEYRDDVERFELSQDMAAVLAGLPEELRVIAARLMAGRSITKTARELSIPRSTLMDRIQQLRELLIEADLDKYL